jgi:subtilisin family serine protease
VSHRFVQVFVGVFVALFLVSSFAAVAAAGAVRTPVLVGYQGDFADAARAIRGHGGTVDVAYRNFPLVAATVPAGAVGAIASSRGIAFVEPVMARYVTSHILEGSLWGGSPQIMPWGTTSVRAPEAWALDRSRGAGVRVAVLDTGFDLGHPDLARNFRVDLGFDFVDNDADPSDTEGPFLGHGTSTSGNIAAIDNRIGTVGVAPEATILPFRVCDSLEGICFTSAIVAAIDAAVSNGADVISMSFSGPAASRAEKMALGAAFSAGVVLVASSGNAGRPPVGCPACLAEVIAVGATDIDNAIADFSSFGKDQELVGPGVDVPTPTVRGLGREAALMQTAPVQAGLHPNPLEFTALTDGLTAPLAFAGRATTQAVAALDLTGRIALIERGDITFAEKVANVAGKGALAAVIYNNAAGNFLGTLGEPSTIPAVSISREEGLALKAQLDAGTVVEVSLVVIAIDYDLASGTSFSAPHVSGVAALVIAASGLSGQDVRLILQRTATDLGAPGYDTVFGFGLVNAEAAVASGMT